MKQQCKTCSKNCEGEYCFRHKPKNRLIVKKQINNTSWKDRAAFFLMIWRKRIHKSEVSGESLGSEPLSVFFHHILPKEKYPEAEYDEENIILLTLDEHTNVESNIYKYDKINYLRDQLLIKYNLK